jgi:hypothetical protein
VRGCGSGIDRGGRPVRPVTTSLSVGSVIAGRVVGR